MSKTISISVGKYTLESLTTGMYSDPKIVYREYIQNSVDALENAVSNNIINESEARINIIIDKDNSSIIIEDNGTGISVTKTYQTLLNIGNSEKRHSSNRGFRGIGRLGGMSYCDELVFTTSYNGESIKSVISFNCRKLRTLLVPGQYEDLDLENVLSEITTISTAYEEESSHYFRVELTNVSSFSDLLDFEKIKSYISQVAPLSYARNLFYHEPELNDFFIKNNVSNKYFNIWLGDNDNPLMPLYKPYKTNFHGDRSKRKPDYIKKLEVFRVENDNELYAIGWYADCNWLGTVSESEVCGLRVRKGNILIGDAHTLNAIFKESRFNGWVQGEVFVLSDKLIPNARRDDFEQNEDYFIFIELLKSGVGNRISETIRNTSKSRNDNSARLITEVKRKIEEAKHIENEGFNSSVDKSLLINELNNTRELVGNVKFKENQKELKNELEKDIEKTIEKIEHSTNFKVNQINTGIDKKTKKVISIITDILSEKLSKELVDQLVEEIIAAINKK